MAEPQSDFLFNGTFDENDWLEAVGMYSVGQLSVGKQRAVATMTAYIEDFSKLKACVNWLRGWSWVDENLELRRFRPARHPYYANLVCTEILECRGLQFDKKQDITSDEMDLPFAKYKKFKLTASFNTVPYLIMDDGEAETEDERWTTFNPKPYYDAYSLQMGEMKYIADNPHQTFDGQAVVTPIVIRSQKSLFELKWYEVPISFIRDDNGMTPKLSAAVGKISSDEYAGQPAGTWLVDAADVEIYNDPIVGDILGTVGRMANVVFHLKYWNPQPGHATDPTTGWNLELAIDGQGWPVTRSLAGAALPPKFQSTAMASLFTHWSLP